ncbi:Uncharacterized protein Fot_41382 [Forsythia ovata]|uniref:Uncharacterized protein n=1 Tax=Forsythia ovata TaxID=205694 RepID=A0ABD1RI63_9LAMI
MAHPSSLQSEKMSSNIQICPEKFSSPLVAHTNKDKILFTFSNSNQTLLQRRAKLYVYVAIVCRNQPNENEITTEFDVDEVVEQTESLGNLSKEILISDKKLAKIWAKSLVPLAVELEQIRGFRTQMDLGQFNINNHPRSRGKSKKLSGKKRPGASIMSNKDPNRLSGGLDNGNFGMDPFINYLDMLKECKQILTKLMKHKNGWIFNAPVDAAALGLFDHHQIVK